jgi:hypothetical protein
MRRAGMAVVVATGALLFATTGSASADAAQVQPPGPVSTAGPTPPPIDPEFADPLGAPCRMLTFVDSNGEGQAIVPGRSMQIGTTVRNTLDVPEDTFYMKIQVSVYYAKAPFGSAPFVLQWSRDNGAWHSAAFTYQGGPDPTWSTAKIPADPIPNGKSSTFRLKLSFESRSPRGWYWSYISFGTETCDEGVTNSMTFTYNPERIVTHSPRPAVHPSASKSTAPSPTTPEPTPSTSPPLPPPAIATPHSDRLTDFSRPIGTGLSGVLLVVALVQAMRGRRRRKAATDDRS